MFLLLRTIIKEFPVTAKQMWLIRTYEYKKANNCKLIDNGPGGPRHVGG